MSNSHRNAAGETCAASAPSYFAHAPHERVSGPRLGYSPRDDEFDGGTDLGIAEALEYQSFAVALRGDLAPATTLEHVMVERVVLAAWRLHQISRGEAIAILADEDLPDLDRATLRAECSLETALALLSSARKVRGGRWGHADFSASTADAAIERSDDRAEPEPFDAYFGNEWPSFDDERHDDEPLIPEEEDVDDEHEADPAPGFRWHERLTLDPSVSSEVPVVRGTWITATQIVSLIVDGWSWSDILRAHPELTEEDIRACLAYTVEVESRGEF